jgi:hypothetical protein
MSLPPHLPLRSPLAPLLPPVPPMSRPPALRKPLVLAQPSPPAPALVTTMVPLLLVVQAARRALHLVARLRALARLVNWRLVLRLCSLVFSRLRCRLGVSGAVWGRKCIDSCRWLGVGRLLLLFCLSRRTSVNKCRLYIGQRKRAVKVGIEHSASKLD